MTNQVIPQPEINHTPKQWISGHTAGHSTHGQSAVYDEQTGRDIAIVYDGQAHARLIAAAPELLEACEAVLTHLPDATLPDSWDYESAKLLRAAIAKATSP
jgi:hypothetical protein